MNRREFIGAAGLLGSAAAAAGAGERKNVLLIVSDDMNAGAGFYGDPIVKTPHLDALARRSVVFDRAYCQFPLCAPSRASFLSGRRPDKTGVWTLHIPTRKYMPDVLMLPELFRRNGWYTAGIGKIFHNGPDHEDPLQAPRGTLQPVSHRRHLGCLDVFADPAPAVEPGIRQRVRAFDLGGRRDEDGLLHS